MQGARALLATDSSENSSHKSHPPNGGFPKLPKRIIKKLRDLSPVVSWENEKTSPIVGTGSELAERKGRLPFVEKFPARAQVPVYLREVSRRFGW